MYFYYTEMHREGLEFIRLTLLDASFDSADDRRIAINLIELIGGSVAEQIVKQDATRVGHFGLYRSRSEWRGFRLAAKLDFRTNSGKLSWYLGNRRVWVDRLQIVELLDLEPGSIIANARILGGFVGMLLVGSIVQPAIEQSKTGTALIAAGARAFDDMAEVASDVVASVLHGKDLNGKSHQDGKVLEVVAILSRRREELELLRTR